MIELGGFLKGDAMPRVVEAKHTGTRNARSKTIGLRRANQDVETWAHEKRRVLDPRQSRLGRMAHDRVKLSKHGSKRRGAAQPDVHMFAELTADRP